MKMRVHRALARAGVASRRTAEGLIRQGRVRVNGAVVTIGAQADPERDTITIDGKRIAAVRIVWIALHKPLGYVVSRRDPEGRATIFSLVPQVPGLTYVGRLDVMTSGLLLLTNDGTGANRLTHPRYGVERRYRAVVHGHTLEETRRRLARAIPIDGRPVALTDFAVRPAANGEALEVTLTLTEGRYRIVRRLAEQLGLKVERLVRLSHGPVSLGRLPAGEWRYLTKTELGALGALTSTRT